MKIFVIREHRFCSKAHQLKKAVEFGVEAARIWMIGSKRKQHSIDDVIRAAADGDEVGVTHLWLLAEATGKTKVRDQMCDAVAALLSKGCLVTEMTTPPRTCTGGAELAVMIKEASNVLARGNRGGGGSRGPSKVQVYSEDEARTIGDIWRRKDMINDAMRLAEVRSRGGVFTKMTVTGWYRDVKPMLADVGNN